MCMSMHFHMVCFSGRVEWEFWTSSNDGCGAPCDRQSTFKKEMRDSAVEMEKVGTHVKEPCLRQMLLYSVLR